MNDDCGWVAGYLTLTSGKGIELHFQVQIGDGGELFGYYGPYQIRDGEGADTEGETEGESW